METADQQRAPLIAQIAVEGLFGQYSYTLPTSGTLSTAAILYGDNGSGKTTILNLIFHALSPANNRGHRGALLGIPFRSFALTLSNGYSINAHREGATLTGAYRLIVRRGQSLLADWFYEEEEAKAPTGPAGYDVIKEGESFRLVPKRTPSSISGNQAFIGVLKSLGLTVYMLNADRQISSDSLDQEAPEDRAFAQETRRRNLSVRAARDLILRQTIRNAQRWIRQKALVSANEGSRSVNTVYTDVIQSIVRAKRGGQSDRDVTEHKSEVLKQLDQLARRTAEYAKYQFVTSFNANELINSLSSATGRTAEAAINVLEPFINSLQARLDAVSENVKLTDVFVQTLNGFYVDKAVRFGVIDGLKIINRDGGELEPTMLSSGEQQLLMLFCHALFARDTPSIFIIDEPELSLNVKWQRKLVGALLDVISGGVVQFVFASHSIELLTQHQDKVVALERTAARRS